MAEATRKKVNKTKNQESVDLPNTSESPGIATISNHKITDEFLEKRLKSLTSFVNNLDPKEKKDNTEQTVITFFFIYIF